MHMSQGKESGLEYAPNRLSWDGLMEGFGEKTTKMGELVQFEGIGNKDAYNPAFINEDGKKYLAVRVESRESYWLDPNLSDTQTLFFFESDRNWQLDKSAPVFQNLEDPFAQWISGESGHKYLLFGGVRIDRSGTQPRIATEFFRGKNIQGLDPKKPFARIYDMKDIRVIQRRDGKFVVLTRPQGGKADVGSIGVVVIENLKGLNQETVESAPFLDLQIVKGLKVGSNMAFLDEDDIVVIGHVVKVVPNFLGDSRYPDQLHYAAMSFRINANDPLVSPPEKLRLQIIATRENFEGYGNPSLAKHPNLENVVFPGGLDVDVDDEDCDFYCGLSDAEVGKFKLHKSLIFS